LDGKIWALKANR